jgi:hypothetical protein
LFRSGNHEHPSDKLYNTTIEVLPDQLNEESIVWQQYNTTTDGYLIVGSFNAFGLAEGSVDNRIGKLRELRLHVHTESENWVILSEVSSCNIVHYLIIFTNYHYIVSLEHRSCFRMTKTLADKLSEINLKSFQRCSTNLYKSSKECHTDRQIELYENVVCCLTIFKHSRIVENVR